MNFSSQQHDTYPLIRKKKKKSKNKKEEEKKNSLIKRLKLTMLLKYYVIELGHIKIYYTFEYTRTCFIRGIALLYEQILY